MHLRMPDEGLGTATLDSLNCLLLPRFPKRVRCIHVRVISLHMHKL